MRGILPNDEPGIASRFKPYVRRGPARLVLAARPGRAAAVDCTACHDQGKKLAKSAHAGLTCDTCHESHNVFPIPAGIPKPECATCHADQAGDYASGVHGLARKNGNESAPDCALCHGSAHELLPPKSQAFRTAVPDTCGMCHSDVVEQYRPACTARPWRAASRRRRSAPIATASTRSSSTPTRASPVNAGAHPRHLRKLPRRRPARPQVRAALGPPGELRFLLPRAGRQGRRRRPWPTAPVATASTTFCRRPTRNPPSIRRTCPRPAASAIRAPGRDSPSARCTWRTGAAEPAALALGAPVLPAADSGDHRADAAAQRRRLDAQADPRCAVRAAVARAARRRASRTPARRCACCPSSACSTPCWRSRS